MAVGLIPIVKNNYDFQMRISLGDAKVSLRCYYNTREDMWHMDLRDMATDASLLGLALTPGVELTDIDSIWGAFYLQDTDPNAGPITRDDFGTRLLLLQYTATELAEFQDTH